MDEPFRFSDSYGKKVVVTDDGAFFCIGFFTSLGLLLNPLYMQMWRGFFLIGILFIYVILIIVGIAGHKLLSK